MAAAEIRRDERVPFGLKLAFGAPTFAGAAMAIPIAIHLNKFYADVVLVPLAYLGIAIAVARAFDAITDPVMGWLSDRTRTRWGRRRPYLAIGAPLCALAFWALFSPPAHLSGTQAIAWFAATFALYYLFHTVYMIPHFALGPELTLDYHERSTLYGVREACLVLGTVCAALVPGFLTARLGDEREALSLFAAIFGGLLVVLYGWLVVRVRERPEFARREPNPLVPGVRRALRNRPFVILLGSSLAGAVPGVLAGTLIPFFNAYVIQPDDPVRWLSIFLATYFGSAFVTLPLWVWAARRYGKRPLWLLSFAVTISGSGLAFFMGPGDAVPFLLLLSWAGAGFGATSFLGLAIKADVIDYDELLTGKRREAQFTALWSIFPKFVMVPGAAVPLAVLGSIGYVPNAVQTPEVVLAIKSLFAFGTASFSSLALLIAWQLPMTEPVHRAILRAVERRARGELVVDPVTGRALAPRDGSFDEASGWFLDHFSAGELRRSLGRGPGILVRDVVASGSIALATSAAAAAFVLSELSNPLREPGVLAVGGVVVSGFSLAIVCFHALRLRAALRLVRNPAPDAELRAHLDRLATRGERSLASRRSGARADSQPD